VGCPHCMALIPRLFGSGELFADFLDYLVHCYSGDFLRFNLLYFSGVLAWSLDRAHKGYCVFCPIP